MNIRLLTLTAFALGLSGCGLSAFVEPKANPVIEDKVGGLVGTLATTAERRIVLVPIAGS